MRTLLRLYIFPAFSGYWMHIRVMTWTSLFQKMLKITHNQTATISLVFAVGSSLHLLYQSWIVMVDSEGSCMHIIIIQILHLGPIMFSKGLLLHQRFLATSGLHSRNHAHRWCLPRNIILIRGAWILIANGQICGTWTVLWLIWFTLLNITSVQSRLLVMCNVYNK